jgi:hypothetical protein
MTINHQKWKQANLILYTDINLRILIIIPMSFSFIEEILNHLDLSHWITILWTETVMIINHEFKL